MYAKSLESTRYLLLTEFEGRTACNRTSFFRSDLWPKHKVRRSHKLSRKNMLVLTVSTYVIEQQNFLRYLHLALKEGVRWTKSVQVVNNSATYSSIFGGLGNKFTKWFFPEGFLMHQKSSGFCWCLLQRKTVYFENSDNTLTQFVRFMLLISHQNVCKTRVFHATQPNNTKGRN